MLDIALWVIAGVIALFALDRVLLWIEGRGWIYWRKVKSKSGAGDVLTGFGFSDPGTRDLEEARRENVVEDEDDGDDDGHRKDFDRLTQRSQLTAPGTYITGA